MGDWPRDEIVEDRVWRSGVEIVSHVNLTRIASVRRALGLIGETGIMIGSLRRARDEVRPQSLRAPRRVRSAAA